MKRRPIDTSDSLELLLDTISNAFGGILFLALLVGLLLQLSHRPSEVLEVSEAAQLEMMELDDRFAAAVSELHSLEQAATVQRASREGLVDPKAAEVAEQVKIARQQVSDLQSKVLAAEQLSSKTQVAIDRTGRQQSELDDGLSRLREKVMAAQSQLKTERRNRSQVISPPRARSTQKFECAIVLRYDRVYLEQIMEDGLFSREINLNDFVIVGEENGVVHITPNPIRGLRVNETGAFNLELGSKLQNYDARQWYITVVAYGDSFDKFQDLKAALLALGYEFRIIPALAGGIYSKSSGVNPLVQ